MVHTVSLVQCETIFAFTFGQIQLDDGSIQVEVIRFEVEGVDLMPNFTEDLYIFTIDEDATGDYPIGEVSATDEGIQKCCIKVTFLPVAGLLIQNFLSWFNILQIKINSRK